MARSARVALGLQGEEYETRKSFKAAGGIGVTKKPQLPRDSAGSFKLPAIRPGHITMMCSTPGHLEIYTPDETFKVQSPEGIDPARTNPNAMWVNAKTHDVGSSSPFVARSFIMASEMLRHPNPVAKAEREPLLMRMYRIKELLLQCQTANETYQRALTVEVAALDASAYKLTQGGRALEKFPVVPDIDSKATAFLIAARRTITEIVQIAGHFWNLGGKKHGSLIHLVEKELAPALGAEHRLISHLRNYTEGVERIIRLRNGQEHTSTTKGSHLHVHNFELMPTNQLRHPTWFLDGEQPEDISTTMAAVPDFLLDLCESFFIGCIDSTIDQSAWPPIGIAPIDPVKVECPTRFELVIDVSRLQLPIPPKP